MTQSCSDFPDPWPLPLAAELRLALRRRSLLWWGVLPVAGFVQLGGPLANAAIAAVVAWMLGIDVHARALLRESETRTAGLVFTAPPRLMGESVR